jgi:hypothetical protein
MLVVISKFADRGYSPFELAAGALFRVPATARQTG